MHRVANRDEKLLLDDIHHHVTENTLASEPRHTSRNDRASRDQHTQRR